MSGKKLHEIEKIGNEGRSPHIVQEPCRNLIGVGKGDKEEKYMPTIVSKYTFITIRKFICPEGLVKLATSSVVPKANGKCKQIGIQSILDVTLCFHASAGLRAQSSFITRSPKRATEHYGQRTSFGGLPFEETGNTPGLTWAVRVDLGQRPAASPNLHLGPTAGLFKI